MYNIPLCWAATLQMAIFLNSVDHSYFYLIDYRGAIYNMAETTSIQEIGH
jgi:hypothetical protein